MIHPPAQPGPRDSLTATLAGLGSPGRCFRPSRSLGNVVCRACLWSGASLLRDGTSSAALQLWRRLAVLGRRLDACSERSAAMHRPLSLFARSPLAGLPGINLEAWSLLCPSNPKLSIMPLPNAKRCSSLERPTGWFTTWNEGYDTGFGFCHPRFSSSIHRHHFPPHGRASASGRGRWGMSCCIR